MASPLSQLLKRNSPSTRSARRRSWHGASSGKWSAGRSPKPIARRSPSPTSRSRPSLPGGWRSIARSVLIGEEQADALATGRGRRDARPGDGLRPHFDSRRNAGRSVRADRPGPWRTTRHILDLDPIDGTKGFLRREQYAVALALVRDGHVELGVLGCPELSEPFHADPNDGGIVDRGSARRWHVVAAASAAETNGDGYAFRPTRSLRLPGCCDRLRKLIPTRTNSANCHATLKIAPTASCHG